MYITHNGGPILVCPKTCAGIDTVTIATGPDFTITHTCIATADCKTALGKVLDKFCLPVANYANGCKTYFMDFCADSTLANTVLVPATNCDRPLEEAGVCIVSTQLSTSGNSNHYTGCALAYNFVNDYVCGTCTGTNEYVDGIDGYNCKVDSGVATSSCVNNYMYSFSSVGLSPLKLRVC